jgi:predicted ATPase/DNA-binding SARP family transcriptional activator
MGTPRLFFGERCVSLGSRPRLITLLALLLRARGRPIARDEAAFLLWPDASEAAARAELRRHLHFLGGAFEAAGAVPPILREGRTLRIDPEVRLWVDAHAFEDARDADLEEALASYGTFLSGFDDEWIVAERERLQAIYVHNLERAAAGCQAVADLSGALRWTLELQRTDPYREETVRSLMRLHVALGDRASALAAYRAFRLRLRRELDVEPMAATAALHADVAGCEVAPLSEDAVRRTMLERAQARDRPGALRSYAQFVRELADLGAKPEPATEALAASLRDLSAIAAPWTARDLLPNTLPVFVTALVGRERDVSAIAALARESRLVTVLGGAGIGKTRAVCAAAERLLLELHDGVYFADLGDLARDDAVVARIARATGTAVPPACDPLEALASEFHARRSLIVVDNCEHVPGGAARAIALLLRRCPGLRIVATSRTLLFLENERAYDLAPLATPPEGPEPPFAQALEIPSVALFVARYATNERRAREVRAFLAETLAICRHVDGVPLALELAACAGRHDTLRALLASLRAGTSRRERSDARAGRWRSLDDALDWSVRLLGAGSRRLLERTSVFAGTFSLDAAAAVADTPQSTVARGLAELCDTSLLVCESVDPPAYRFLAPMREHARDLLRAGDGAPAAWNRYARHMLELAETYEREFGSMATVDWVERFTSASADLECVLDLALAGTVEMPLAFALLPAMRAYWYATDPLRGLSWLQRFEERSAAEATDVERGRFLSTRSGLLGALGKASESLSVAEAAVALLERGEQSRALGIALRDLGDALGLGGDERAEAAYARATGIFRACDDRARLASTLTQSAIYAYNRGDSDGARRWYEEARALAGAIDELRSFASATSGLGELEFSLGNVSRAIDLAGEAIAGFRRLRSDVGLWVTLANRSAYHLALGNAGAARADFLAALDPLERTGSANWSALAMQQAAALAAETDPEAAATLLGFSAARVSALAIHREPVGARQYRDLIARLEVERADAPLRAHFERGAGLPQETMLALARRVAGAEGGDSRSRESGANERIGA